MSRGFRKFDSLMLRESLRWSEEAENVLYYYIMPIYANLCHIYASQSLEA